MHQLTHIALVPTMCRTAQRDPYRVRLHRRKKNPFIPGPACNYVYKPLVLLKFPVLSVGHVGFTKAERDGVLSRQGGEG